MKLGIVLFNLGGPDSPEAVEPFLRNLFSDPAIISLPGLLRLPLARFIAWRRAPLARAIYAHIGGRSPILAETERQARALEVALNGPQLEAKAVIAMRCWHPFSDQAAASLKAFGAERIVLLPLYPQFSTTTSASSLKDWTRAARKAGLTAATTRVCCYPGNAGFIAGAAANVRAAMENPQTGVPYRLLLSAHGLPKRTIARGDPYQWQVEQTARALVDALGIKGLDWSICYQSRVGPLKWLEPSTDAEIRRAGQDGKGVIVAPIAFVSEHSETLVELDIEYGKLAREAGVPDYRRAATVSAGGAFIEGLADLVRKAVADGVTVSDGEGRICPAMFGCCGYREK
ncbi:MAG TPA: ferrochelatase [Rhizomicrobium sp.]|nr:ferrochelatase [Rhizomicrobium sp.]